MTGDLPQAPQISFVQELWRKAIHLVALVIPVGYHVFGFDKATMLQIMVPIFLGMFLVDVARLRRWWLWQSLAKPIFGRMIRDHERNGDFTGAVYILGSACVTVALYSKPVAIAALAFIIVGDAFAAVIGRRFGRTRLGSRKTLEGSLGCLFGTCLVAFFAPGVPLSVALIGAVAATAAEAYPFGIDDNVTVPVLSGLVMTLISRGLGIG